MKPATTKQLKEELQMQSHSNLVKYCLRLAKFKRENKELLSYLLYDSYNEADYINEIKHELSELFAQVNTRSPYIAKKNLRKILRLAQRYIRYSEIPETGADIYLFICIELQKINWHFTIPSGMQRIFSFAQNKLQSAIEKLHEDLKYEYTRNITWKIST